MECHSIWPPQPSIDTSQSKQNPINTMRQTLKRCQNRCTQRKQLLIVRNKKTARLRHVSDASRTELPRIITGVVTSTNCRHDNATWLYPPRLWKTTKGGTKYFRNYLLRNSILLPTTFWMELASNWHLSSVKCVKNASSLYFTLRWASEEKFTSTSK